MVLPIYFMFIGEILIDDLVPRIVSVQYYGKCDLQKVLLNLKKSIVEFFSILFKIYFRVSFRFKHIIEP